MYGAYLPRKPHRVLVLGSGALRIGQAGEFDYSGSQAIKALKEERISSVLVNPNIATIQTSGELADRTYLLAVEPDIVEQIIEKERVDSILLSFGGQTALNCGLELHRSGVLERHGVRVLGTPIESIENTEDRHLFTEKLREINVKTAKSTACDSVESAREAAREIGLPVMLRGAYALGGKGSGVVEREDQLEDALRRSFDGDIPQVLVEEDLRGWKEIEYEIVRDARDNCIAICNMENFDPMGIHTGDSIVVAPSQTLTDHEYQMLRSISIKTVRHLGIVGECNIQFALDPVTSDYRVIEVNARLSRSSALASKATGYPLAYVAAKLAVGYALPDIPNSITRRTSAFFEPSLDYIVCKIPRWDIAKFRGASSRIGTEMKSVGEVMAIGRSFPEVVQKALRMLDTGASGLDADRQVFDDPMDMIRNPTPQRIFAIGQALEAGTTVEEIHEASRIDPWFLHGLKQIVDAGKELAAAGGSLSAETLRGVKELGFADTAIDRLSGQEAGFTRRRREEWAIMPNVACIDTTAAEFPAETNYMYSTYRADVADVEPSNRPKIIVLGSGPYRIGSSVEFDWCCVNAVEAAAELGYETMMVNCNPETVSTDYDICDKLLFDEISFETICDLYAREQPDGVIVSMGGQLPNNLALELHEAGVKILGTSPVDIDRAEDRNKFSDLLDKLGADQPLWATVTDTEELESAVEKLGGFPVVIRPSYVLSGAAMSVAQESHGLHEIIDRAQVINSNYPVVISKFEAHAREIEFDAVADDGELVAYAISEHIENAGVHSGDATLVLPPQTLYIATLRRIRKIAADVAREMSITGPFNMQFLAKRNVVKVIELNLRASRSFPFVSKVTGNNFVKIAVGRMLGVKEPVDNSYLDADYVAVKAPMFSFDRLMGADPTLGIEMGSTGEVGCFGIDFSEALLNTLRATGFKYPKRGILLSLGPLEDKFWFSDEARIIADDLGLPIFATEGTAEALQSIGIACQKVEKDHSGPGSAAEAISNGAVDLIINVPREFDELGRPDGYLIRRRAVDTGTFLVTDLQLARAVIEALRWHTPGDLSVSAWQDFHVHELSAV